MRVWLDPEKAASRGLTADDVVKAIREQNIQVAAGQLGAPPLPSATEFQVAINAKGRLTTEEDFRSIIVKTGAGGQVTRLKDVARIELGADTYALRALLDNKAAAAIPIFQRPGSNSIAISELVRARLRASQAQSDAAAANYEKVVLTALEDTENSFVAYSSGQAQLKSLNEQAQASRRAAELAEIQYREGVADFLVLLDAQRTQLDAEDSVAQAETAVNVSVVAIYKALGGVGQPLSGEAAVRVARIP
jgi:hypothetical protein